MSNITESKAWHDNATIKGSIVLKLAQHEGVELPSGTTLSRGWLYRFQQRTGLWFSLRHGEGNSVDEELMKEEMKALQAVVAGYHPLDVYNMDETAFYYRREPRGLLTTTKKEKGKKQSKHRITPTARTGFLSISLGGRRCCAH
ncbi:hypothetical protein JG688_00016535 [Phytophthora aleatoria]|uniref:HTH CENPB-type domain-containing protein n=1 Tax=Phytophthora aleatoria TaxID=2496075 RepID=A0A8J5LYY5_9STRA|nr:hypothetical protein JG688_00016535 [Phytophthora aleatoria]